MKQNNLPNFNNYGYQAIERLGSNYQGGRTTYKALLIDTQEPVVIKQFRFATENADWSGYKAVEREIQVLKNLDHPGIPRYLDSFDSGDGICLVQEYKSAQPLSGAGSFTAVEVKNIAVQVLAVLVYLQQLHPPIIHRDLKPENILIDQELKVYLVDFGIAKFGTGEAFAMSSLISGTPGFMPPEQLLNRPVTKATDLYGLGATLICLLKKTDSTAVSKLIDSSFKFDFQELTSQVSPDFLAWLEQMVEPNLEGRFANAQIALQALENIEVNHEVLSNDSKQIVEFKASELGQKVTKNIVINNLPSHLDNYDTLVSSSPIPSWLSLTPKQLTSNIIEYQVTVDTNHLELNQLYESQITIGRDSELQPYLLEIKVETLLINNNFDSRKIVFLLSLFGVSFGAGLLAAFSFTTNLLIATNLLVILSCLLFFGLFITFKFLTPTDFDPQAEDFFTKFDRLIIQIITKFQQHSLLAWLIMVLGLALGIGCKISFW